MKANVVGVSPYLGYQLGWHKGDKVSLAYISLRMVVGDTYSWKQELQLTTTRNTCHPRSHENVTFLL